MITRAEVLILHQLTFKCKCKRLTLHWSSETEIHLVQAHQRLELLREELHVLGHGVVAAGGEDTELHQVALRQGIKIVNI